jgi:hypothetical protein
VCIALAFILLALALISILWGDVVALQKKRKAHKTALLKLKKVTDEIGELLGYQESLSGQWIQDCREADLRAITNLDKIVIDLHRRVQAAGESLAGVCEVTRKEVTE